MARCALCGHKGSLIAGVNDVKLHHDEEHLQIGTYAINGEPIAVTCYTAWTVFGKRPDKPKRAPKHKPHK